MQVVVTMLMICLTALSINGCASKCTPVVKYVKPEVPKIEAAKVEQCRYKDQLENVKCVLGNYMEVRKERDMLREALGTIAE